MSTQLLTSDNSQSADTTSHGLGDMEYTRHQRLLEPEVDSTPTRGKAMPRAEFDHRFKITMGTVRKCIGRYSVLAGRSKAGELRTGRSAPGDLYKAIRLQYSCLRLKHDQIRRRSVSRLPTTMSKTTNHQSDLDSKCVKARPWVRRFVEEYQLEDTRPWGYAIFEDPSIDDEALEDCMCRIDNLLWSAQDAVFGRNHVEFPQFKWEVLGWPEDVGGDLVTESQHDIVQGSTEDGSEDGAGVSGPDDDEATSIQGGEDEDEPDQEDHEDEADDVDIETVRELDKLRAHFKWVRDQAKKRRKAHEPLDVDRGGIPNGLLRNVFLVIDQDVIDAVKSPVADNTWIWVIDPDYAGDVALMTRNGLKGEYYGYMRVRVQQLVNNFWDARRYHESEHPLQMLWAAAQESHNFAFVSVNPEEALMFRSDIVMGSALRAPSTYFVSKSGS
ncbi:hypothetical protein LTR91_010515 [Friedmanniomyces endolithicus]|uniref:Uncharacterized protein n=2 Tax=Friedmanniomyces endolithicus TaxID=329885 RepID=A0AAN6J990_9PEZI|nr:hypothetical protein LTS09_011034 [Friedmanniomyces endolithicus]KAK0322046.1 hypothetical protein LTR82_007020 [Friedmanniomyces endolithicus]KAK0827338.1 hypothetical protein LTR73_005574 [Friedmanniomyces endolithicus]KAK0930756.1 hypothetical protein LTR57_001137 [Friedmanniomyces endolithicus]KAK0985779.1 hypothetical protein LTR91_010515 [Friedmanniomyces endolithicus]